MRYSKSVQWWLFTGVLMVFFQIIIGGITRLTESGLSITKWEVVEGTLPPVSEAAWIEAFELYKKTPQYTEINEGMSMSDFKFIYFWEYIHRFWARLMGMVFLLPFLYFVYKKRMDGPLLKRLGVVIVLAGLAATFGWIMVASGLIDRPWVNAYKLSLHLMIALSVYVVLLDTGLFAAAIKPLSFDAKPLRQLFLGFAGLVVLQLFLGGVMSGMKAAVVFPTWPDIRGEYLPSILLDGSQWNTDNFNLYDQNLFMPALIHFLHRSTAYVLAGIGFVFCYRMYRLGAANEDRIAVRLSVVTLIVLLLQVILGIITVLMSVGKVPVLWGVLHQAVAIVLLSTLVYSFFTIRIGNK